VEAAGEDAVHSGKEAAARAQVTIERRGIWHCAGVSDGGLLS
jgi:hypothetical protein